MIKHIFAIFD